MSVILACFSALVFAGVYIYLAVKFSLHRSFVPFVTRNKEELERQRRSQFNVLMKGKIPCFLKSLTDFNTSLKKAGFNSVKPYMPPVAELVLKVSASGFVGALYAVSNGARDGLLLFVAAFCILYYSGVLALKRRRALVEDAVPEIVKKVVFSSVQYRKITDIFGAIYSDFDGEIRDILCFCYMEASFGRKEEDAVKRLREYVFSPMFDIAINNLFYCKVDGRNLEDVSKILLEVVTPYSNECRERREFISMAKSRETIALILSLLLVVGVPAFFGGVGYIVAFKVVPIVVLMMITYIYGANIER